MILRPSNCSSVSLFPLVFLLSFRFFFFSSKFITAALLSYWCCCELHDQVSWEKKQAQQKQIKGKEKLLEKEKKKKQVGR